MTEHLDVQAIANVTLADVAGGIGELAAYEISDFMLMVADEMDEPEDIMKCCQRLKAYCERRFGPQPALL